MKLDFQTIEKWLTGSGDRDLVYHTGNLAHARERRNSHGGFIKVEPLNSIASYLLALSDEGRVVLFQKRVREDACKYIARRV